MADVIRKCDTVLLRGTGTRFRPDVRHLHLTLRDEDNNGRILLVPVGTQKPNSDCTCAVAVGDHPFIRHASVVLFGRARLFVYGALLDGLRNGTAEKSEPMTEELHRRVCACLRRSPFSPGWSKKSLGKPL